MPPDECFHFALTRRSSSWDQFGATSSAGKMALVADCLAHLAVPAFDRMSRADLSAKNTENGITLFPLSPASGRTVASAGLCKAYGSGLPVRRQIVLPGAQTPRVPPRILMANPTLIHGEH